MDKRIPKFLSILIICVLVLFIINIIRFTKNRFTNSIPEGLVESKAKLEVGTNALLTPAQRVEAVQRLSHEIYDAIKICSKMIDEKLFFFDIWFERPRGKSGPWMSHEAFQKNIYVQVVQPDLIDLYAHDDATHFFSQNVSCSYNPVSHRATGMKYPEGLNIMGVHKDYQSEP